MSQKRPSVSGACSRVSTNVRVTKVLVFHKCLTLARELLGSVCVSWLVVFFHEPSQPSIAVVVVVEGRY